MNRFQLTHPRLATLFALATLLGAFGLLAVVSPNHEPREPERKSGPLPVTLGDCAELGNVENGRLVDFSPDGNTLAVVTEGGFTDAGPIRLWNARTGKERASVAEGWNQMQVISFSPDSTMIAVYDKANGIGVWDVATGKQRDAFKPPTIYGNCVSFWFSPDSQSLLFKHFGENFPNDDLYKIRDISARQERGSISSGWVFGFSADGSRLATGVALPNANNGRKVMLWDWPEGKLPVLLRERSVGEGHFALSRNFTSYATADISGQPRATTRIQIVDMNTGRQRLAFTHTDEETHIQEMFFSRDGNLLIANGGGGTQLCWTTRSTVWDISGKAARKIGSYAVEPEVSLDGRLLGMRSVTEKSEAHVSLLDVATGQEKGVLTREGDVTGSYFGRYNNHLSYPSVSFSPDGRIVIVRGVFNLRQGQIARVWQVEPLTELCVLKSCCDVKFSPNGRAFVMLTLDNSLKLWRIPPAR